MNFSFGQGGSNTPKQNPFGAANTSGGSTPSLFGSAGNNAGSGSNTPAAKPTFGSGTSGGSTLFGGASTTPAAGKPSLFGANQATTGVSQPASSAPSFSFGKPAASTTNAGDNGAPKTSLFGSAGNGAAPSGTASPGAPSFAFGSQTSGTYPPSTQHSTTGSGVLNVSASTPAPNKTFSLNSTTPAGPPPGTSLFGGQQTQQPTGSQAQPTSSLFAPKPATTSASSTPGLFGSAAPGSTPAKPLGGTSSAFPGFAGLGSGTKDASSDANKSTPAQQPQPASGTSLFSGGTASGTLGTQATQGTPKPSLFGAVGSTTPATTPASKPPTFSLGTTPASTQPALSSVSTPAFSLGGNQPKPASTGPAQTSLFNTAGSGTGASTGGFSFPKLGGSTPASTPALSGAATTTAPAASSGTAAPLPFPSLGGTPASSGPASTGAPAPSPFNLGNKPGATSTPASISTTTTAPAATSGAGTTSTLGGMGSTSNDAAKSGLAASTAGPAPSTQSRLKNKSMDEIITRWAADLSKYQKEFQTQAAQVAEWDKALVENTDKINKLYSKTFQAERDAGEVERQLSQMEDGQQELEVFLDRYEKEVEQMMRNKGVDGQGRGDGLRGPDQERERTYKLAEKLQDRLNELNKDLTEMIEEINNTSSTLSKTGKPDDPLTKVVRVLNSQLSQLQLIDSGASQLQEKIQKAQKESQRIGANGWNGLGTDPADDFYRSFRGGRTDRFGGVS